MDDDGFDTQAVPMDMMHIMAELHRGRVDTETLEAITAGLEDLAKGGGNLPPSHNLPRLVGPSPVTLSAALDALPWHIDSLLCALLFELSHAMVANPTLPCWRLPLAGVCCSIHEVPIVLVFGECAPDLCDDAV